MKDNPIFALGLVAIVIILIGILLPIGPSLKWFFGLAGISIILFLVSGVVFGTNPIVGGVIFLLALIVGGFALKNFSSATNQTIGLILLGKDLLL